jgi:hypothetical protein
MSLYESFVHLGPQTGTENDYSLMAGPIDVDAVITAYLSADHTNHQYVLIVGLMSGKISNYKTEVLAVGLTELPNGDLAIPILPSGSGNEHHHGQSLQLNYHKVKANSIKKDDLQGYLSDDIYAELTSLVPGLQTDPQAKDEIERDRETLAKVPCEIFSLQLH